MIQEIQRLQSAKPFEPFTVHAADGEAYDVGHPEYISQTPSGRLILIGLDDDSTVRLDLLVVTGIRKPAAGRSGSGPAASQGVCGNVASRTISRAPPAPKRQVASARAGCTSP